MSTRFDFNPAALEGEIMTRAIMPVAERIAERTASRAVMSEIRFGVEVVRVNARLARVTVPDSLAAVEEFGEVEGRTSRPGAPMRSSAAEEPGYRPL